MDEDAKEKAGRALVADFGDATIVAERRLAAFYSCIHAIDALPSSEHWLVVEALRLAYVRRGP